MNSWLLPCKLDVPSEHWYKPVIGLYCGFLLEPMMQIWWFEAKKSKHLASIGHFFSKKLLQVDVVQFPPPPTTPLFSFSFSQNGNLIHHQTKNAGRPSWDNKITWNYMSKNFKNLNMLQKIHLQLSDHLLETKLTYLAWTKHQTYSIISWPYKRCKIIDHICSSTPPNRLNPLFRILLCITNHYHGST